MTSPLKPMHAIVNDVPPTNRRFLAERDHALPQSGVEWADVVQAALTASPNTFRNECVEVHGATTAFNNN